MSQVSIEIAQEKLPELIEDVKTGATVVITQDERPVAQIIPAVRPRRKPVFGGARGLIEIADDFDAPLDDFAEYMQ